MHAFICLAACSLTAYSLQLANVQLAAYSSLAHHCCCAVIIAIVITIAISVNTTYTSTHALQIACAFRAHAGRMCKLCNVGLVAHFLRLAAAAACALLDLFTAFCCCAKSCVTVHQASGLSRK